MKTEKEELLDIAVEWANADIALWLATSDEETAHRAYLDSKEKRERCERFADSIAEKFRPLLHGRKRIAIALPDDYDNSIVTAEYQNGAGITVKRWHNSDKLVESTTRLMAIQAEKKTRKR